MNREMRGSRGRGGRGTAKPASMEFTYNLKVANRLPPEIGERGWKQLPENMDDIRLPVVPQRGTLHKEAESIKGTLSTNHFLATIPILPPTIYRYEAAAERIVEETMDAIAAKLKKTGVSGPPASPRTLPAGLRGKLLRFAVNKLTRDYEDACGTKVGIITDFSNSIWSSSKLEERVKMVLDIKADLLPEVEGTGTFRVKLTPTNGNISCKGIDSVLKNLRTELIKLDPGDRNRLKEIWQVYNVLLKNLGDETYLPMLRRSTLFKIPKIENMSLGEGLVNWTGLSLTYNLGWKTYVNIDIDNSAFVKGTSVSKILEEVVVRNSDRLDVWSKQDIKKASDLLRDCKIRWSVTRDGRPVTNCKNVVGIADRNVSNCKFQYNGREISVLNYYKEVYKIMLKPQGPCVKVSNGGFVPAEICTIKKGKQYHHLTPDQTSKMIDIARKNPKELVDAIQNGITALGMNDKNPLFAAYGIHFDNRMLNVTGARVLKPPTLVYGVVDGNKRSTMTPEIGQGKWDIWGDMRLHYFTPMKIDAWALLVTDFNPAPEKNVNMFAEALVRIGLNRGMTIPKMPIRNAHMKLNDFDQEMNVQKLIKVFQAFQTDFQGSKATFVLVVIPKKNCKVYNHVKQASELHTTGVLTQCIVGKNFNPRFDKFKGEGANEPVIGNLLLKINSKLGGVNHVPLPSQMDIFKKIDILTYPVLIIGVDVNHPSSLGGFIENPEMAPPSFAAITGSIGRTGMPYMMHVQAQVKAAAGAAEIVQNFKGSVVKMLKMFQMKTSYQPSKIIVFRDGVGDSQFPEVLHFEMRDIREACKSLNAEYKPRITFITVQKRHKTRFFLKRQDEVTNAPAGTLVDTDIVHPTEHDFYLQSHTAIQGTARPTRYHLLWDDSDFSPDQIHALTYYLCYAYSRCNRSVRIPAPTYYAHWAAFRAKVLADGFPHKNLAELNQHLLKRETSKANGQTSFSQDWPFHFI